MYASVRKSAQVRRKATSPRKAATMACLQEERGVGLRVLRASHEVHELLYVLLWLDAALLLRRLQPVEHPCTPAYCARRVQHTPNSAGYAMQTGQLTGHVQLMCATRSDRRCRQCTRACPYQSPTSAAATGALSLAQLAHSTAAHRARTGAPAPWPQKPASRARLGCQGAGRGRRCSAPCGARRRRRGAARSA